MKIRIDIDRLVIEGLPIASRDAALIHAAVERELTRLVGDGGIHPHMQSGVALPRVAAPAIRLKRESPARLGESIARSVYGAIGKR
jgi:hypothetical protein